MRNTKPLVTFALLLAIGLFALPATASWKHLKTQDGVSAYISENPKTGLTIIKVKTRIAASLPEVLGVVTDINNSCRWAGRCLEAKILKSKGPFKHRVYSRRKGPWPINDRDFELDSVVDVHKGANLVRVRFWDVKKPMVRPKKGVVRVPVMRGVYRLEKISANVTKYEFQVEADPGGWIPKWVYRWTAEAGPLESAKKLRKLVPRVKAQYAPFVKRFERSVAASQKPAS